MSDEEELKTAIRYIEWRANPCGRPRLRLTEARRCMIRQAGFPTLGVDFPATAARSDRKVVLEVLQANLHANRAFPAKIVGWYEGPSQDGSAYMIELYGDGDEPAVRPQPPRPAYMR